MLRKINVFVIGLVLVTLVGILGSCDGKIITISFEVNGGSTVDAIELTAESELAMPADPIKLNSLFDGWFVDEALSVAFTGKEQISGSTTLYAKWSPATVGLDYLYFDGHGTYDSGYSLVGLGSATTTDIVVASAFDDGKNGLKPVTSINNYFTLFVMPGDYEPRWETITSLRAPSSVTSFDKHGHINDSPWFKGLKDEFSIIGDGLLVKYNGTATKIVIPGNVKYIAGGVFDIIYKDNSMIKEIITDVQIPSSVLGISSEAFFGFISLEKIQIPDSVRFLGFHQTFAYCSKLKEISFGNGITVLPSSVLGYCRLLETVTLPNKLKRTLGDTFWFCEKLTKIDLPESLEILSGQEFWGCTGLTKVTIPKNVTYMGQGVFRECSNLEEVEILGTTEDILSWFFLNCRKLKTVNIPEGVKSIAGSAFRNCTSLTTVTIPETVTRLQGTVFVGCTNLTSIKIPKTVTTIGSDNFRDCPNLSIECEVSSKPDGWADNWNSGRPVTWAPAPHTLTFSNGYGGTISTSEIMSGATFTYPANPTRNGYSFAGWDSSVTTMPSSDLTICATWIAGSDNLEYEYDATLDGGYGGYLLKAIKPEYSDKTLIIPATFDDGVNGSKKVVKIGDAIFMGNESIESVELTENITELGYNVFSACPKLASITVAAANPNYSSIGGHLYNKAATIILTYSPASSATTFTTPATVEEIATFAFSNAVNLTSITISNGVEKIDVDAFADCSNLTSVYIPASVTTIVERTFINCHASLTINCEAASKPAGWHESWHSIKSDPLTYATVNWGE
ncbi:MAG: leucine-rich repeat protein [Spirochaetales bacterium]|nr:leucine-rich repeat protein [Spirochaetales bacterium]